MNDNGQKLTRADVEKRVNATTQNIKRRNRIIGATFLTIIIGLPSYLLYLADQHENKRLHKVAQEGRQNLVSGILRAEKGLPESVKDQFKKAVSEVSEHYLKTGSQQFALAKNKDILTAHLDGKLSEAPYYKKWTAYASKPDKNHTEPMRAYFFLTSEAIAPKSTDMNAIQTAYSKLNSKDTIESAYKFSLTGYFDGSIDGRPDNTDSLEKKLAFYKAEATIHTETAYIAYTPNPDAGPKKYYGPVTEPKHEPIIFVKKADGTFEKAKTDAELAAEKAMQHAAKEAAERKASIERFRDKRPAP